MTSTDARPMTKNGNTLLNLDNLVQSIPDNESALRSDLARWVDEWKRNAESLERLEYIMDKSHVNVWFKR